MPKIPVAPYSILVLATKDENSESQDAKELLEYISSERSRQLALVNHPLNDNPSTFSSGFLRSKGIDSAGSCQASVKCDLHYDIDWSYRLRIELICQDAYMNDPCFATSACLCSNGYFKVANDMPDPKLVQYRGLDQIFSNYKSQREEAIRSQAISLDGKQTIIV